MNEKINWVKEGRLRFEKCEFLEAEKCYLKAYRVAEEEKNLQARFESLNALFRLSAEMQDQEKLTKWDHELNLLMNKYPSAVPPLAFYVKALADYYAGNLRHLRAYTLIYLRALRKSDLKDVELEHARAMGFTMLIKYLNDSGKPTRAKALIQAVLKDFSHEALRNIIGILHLDLGIMAVNENKLEEGFSFIQQAHGFFLEEHNWYYHLYCLYWYATIYRMQEKYKEAEFNLSLVERATAKDPLGYLKSLLAKERSLLDPSSVDITVDESRGVIMTKGRGEILVRKQFVLLDILKTLSKSGENGLSKGQLIKHVWKENYIPQAHDNKLYYNINRLRKLLESNAHDPEFILNWKEGYRFAPGKKIRFIQSQEGGKKNENQVH